MLKLLLKLAVAGAALAAVWAFVPFGGRTLGDRWKAARTPSEFVDRTWAEMKGTAPAKAPPPRPPAQARQQPGRGGTPARPTEGHTEADRRALDRIVAEHLDGR
ncbi:conserved hypothetical protein [Anaeromyxobacter dehalogenans 2CP-1]|uniref:Uncharacterized protein n=1 Tax=Anaeromyxobacter dehalogenans (strain ATCC BAA-258 / DSM 21875 / 2CP-1) TaxID=455488 RepID=B8JG00_ANAD2|nr:hypothetical protein [Anaeromyxobacter dehalogenans]ACL64588.1 conserved hypothetical protein [Anaeromyxobacter dehalogenans 2CP-1]